MSESTFSNARSASSHVGGGFERGGGAGAEELEARRLSEAGRRAAEERFGLFIEYAPAAIAMFDREMRYLAASARWREDCQLTGELAGRSHYDVFPETSAEWREAHRRGLAGEVVRGEDPFKRADGSEQWVKYEIRPWRDAAGDVGGILIFAENTTAQRAAAETVRRSRERADLVSEAAEVGFWFCDLPFDRLQWDARVKEHFWLPADADVTIRTFYERIHPEDGDRTRAAINDSIENRSRYDIEYRTVSPDGAVKWIRAIGRGFYNFDGEPTRFDGVTLDTTDRKRTEEVLTESRERLQAALDGSGAGTFRWDIRTDVLDWDENLDRLFGLPPGKTIRSLGNFISMVHPDERAGVVERCERCAAEGADFDMEFRVVWRDGTIHWLHDTGRTFFDSEGRPLYMTGMCLDVTERKRTEQVEASQKRVMELMVRGAPLPEVLAGVVAMVEEGAGSGMLGSILLLDEDGQRLRNGAAPNLPEAYNRAIDGIVIGPQVGSCGTAAFRREPVYVSDIACDPLWSDFAALALSHGLRACWSTPVFSGAGELLGTLAMYYPTVRAPEAEDLRLVELATRTAALAIERHRTEAALRQAKEQAEAANRAKDNFLAALSHELRTPLTPVLMSAAELREDERLPESARADLAMIERNIALEARLIDDLLDLTRISKGRLDLRRQHCDAHSLIGLAVEIVRDDAQAKGIALESEFAARRTAISADPVRFQQVIWNLLRNAVKFTPHGGRITIRTRDAGGSNGSSRLQIAVQDSGIGIAPEALELIFAPFEQASASGEHRFGGLGLGLAIARAIVDLHGGDIRAESDGLGAGATFVVELPGAVELPPDAQSAEPATGNGAAGIEAKSASLNLLLVEDHEPTLRVLTRLLSRTGHRLTTATSVAEALAAAAVEPPQVVISDLGLPDGTGMELMSQLRDLYGVAGIALSGYGMEEDITRSRSAGFVAHLVKPVDFDELRRVLSEIGAGLLAGR